MRIKIFLFLIFILAILLRILWWQGALTFTYEQARDAFIATSIYTEDPIKILGPMTDIEGVYHGVLYYYFLAPFYFLGKGNPYFPFFASIILNSMTVFCVYLLGKRLFKKISIAIFSSLIFALSFEMTQYARWLSNPSPAVLTIAIVFLSLYLWMEGWKIGLPLAMFAIGLSVQFELFLIYLLLVPPIIWILFRPKTTKKTLTLAIIAFLLSVLSMVLAEIKFGLMGSRALLSFFSTQDLFQKSFTDVFLLFINRLVDVFYYNLFSINLVLAGLLTFYFIFRTMKIAKKQKPIAFLLIWLFSSFLLYFFTGTRANYVNIGLGIPAILLISYFLNENLKTKKYLVFFSLLFIILLGNFKSIIRYNPQGSVLFSVQEKMLLRDELALIDYTYQESENKPFSINSVTNPLFINTNWDYLYNWHGKQNYGYLPEWRGKSQIGYLGENILLPPNHSTKIHFLIIEPTRGIPDYFVNWTRIVENKRSELIETKKFGNFIVEKRKFTAETEEPFDIPIEELKKLPQTQLTLVNYVKKIE